MFTSLISRWIGLAFVSFFALSASALSEGPTYLTEWQNVVLPFYQTTGQAGNFLAVDGIRINYRLFIKPGAKSAIVILPGRGEPAAKFAEVVSDLYAKGYSVFIIDHRGQGESQRLLAPPDDQVGYVGHFSDYVSDLKRFIDEVVEPAVKSNGITKLHLLANSMGGAIGALYLAQEPEVFTSAVLASPMIEINTKPYPYALALTVVSGEDLLGKGRAYALGEKAYDPNATFAGNNTTHSQDRFAMQMLLVADYLKNAWGNLGLGGASNRWVEQGLLATPDIKLGAHNIKTPILILEAGVDDYVTQFAEDEFCFDVRWWNGTCKVISKGYENAYHELLMEIDSVRNQAMQDAEDWFATK